MEFSGTRHLLEGRTQRSKIRRLLDTAKDNSQCSTCVDLLHWSSSCRNRWAFQSPNCEHFEYMEEETKGHMVHTVLPHPWNKCNTRSGEVDKRSLHCRNNADFIEAGRLCRRTSEVSSFQSAEKNSDKPSYVNEVDFSDVFGVEKHLWEFCIASLTFCGISPSDISLRWLTVSTSKLKLNRSGSNHNELYQG